MQKMLHARLSLSFAAAMLVGTLFAFCDVAEAGRKHRRYHTASTASQPRDARPAETLSAEEARQKLAEFCAMNKDDFKPVTREDFVRARKQLLDATNDLIRLIKNDPAKNAAKVWMERLRLEDLRKSLLAEAAPTEKEIDATWNALSGSYNGIRWTIFDPLRLAMRRYICFLPFSKEESGKQSYKDELDKKCKNLLPLLDAYKQNVIKSQDADLTDMLEWFEDVSHVEPKMAQVSELIRATFSGINVRVRIGSDFLTAGFQNKIDNEPTAIRENILGTRVVGSGTFLGDSSARIVETPHRAEININVSGTMESLTTGYNPPVTLNTKSRSELESNKRIVLTADKIFTTPARSHAQMQSTIFNVRVDGGPLVQCIARKQVEKRQGASKAESRRRSEIRMNERIDGRMDDRIAKLNKRYQENVRARLLKSNFFPQIWDLSSTADAIHWAAMFADRSQASAMTPAPDLGKEQSLLVQVHQSALNNASSVTLPGYCFDETKNEGLSEIKERLEKLIEPLTFTKKGDDTFQLTFETKIPIRIGFNGKQITVLLQIDELRRIWPDSGRTESSRNMDILLTYNIKTEKVGDFDVIVLEFDKKPMLSFRSAEESEQPASTEEAEPSTPSAGKGQAAFLRGNVTQTFIRRRLEPIERIVFKPLEASEGEWQGKGKLVPSFATTQNGWLTFGYDWVPSKENRASAEK